ncbi:MAG: TonB-dependent receptor domain-containing protein [Roseateles sp.]|uniref:Outer membrane receptor for ferrienterochelin and colicins n=1 Tax=Roseateles asaccharophilus TaxID=582607 RepID=A0ABU2AJR8_9BURK|nr:TonB-dependent receptor [Roseateles asaccharophilus]MDR7336213.1 outer membrane receptor for ferrienterochelin and colicins [Roseateles asaccharophilus]
MAPLRRTRGSVSASFRLQPAAQAVACLTLAALSAPVAAQTAAQATSAENVLAPVVVSASRIAQKITEAPASISVVSREELSTRPYLTLLDALRDMEGVDVGETRDKAGAGTISIRGMGADYTLVLIDGRRQSNVGDIYPNNFGGSQFSHLPPLEAIERIEVIRGPMSTLYGSDAIGGVINVITRKVGTKWLGSLSVSTTKQTNDAFGDDSTADFYATGPLVSGLLGLAVRGSYYDREASNPEYAALPLPDGTMWTRPLGFGGGGRTVENVAKSGGARLALTPAAGHEVLLDYDVSRQSYDNSEAQLGTRDGVDSLWRTGNKATLSYANPFYRSTYTGTASNLSTWNPQTLTRAVVANPGFDPSRAVTSSNAPFRNVLVAQPRVGYTEQQRFTREQVSLSHIGRFDRFNTEVILSHVQTANLGRSQPLTVEERAELLAYMKTQGQVTGGELTGGITTGVPNAAQSAWLNANLLPRERRTMEVRQTSLDGKVDFELGSQHYVVLGAQILDAKMEDSVFGMVGGGYQTGVIQPHKQWALFAEDNWAISKQFTLTAGIRYDNHNVFGSRTSPRVYGVWNAAPNWTVKGGISTGYKTPKTSDLYPGVTGFGGQGVSPMVGTPGLRPETSVNGELAVYYETAALAFNATVFTNRFRNKIATAENVPNCELVTAGQACVDLGVGWADLGYTGFSQKRNIDRAEARGIELAGRVQLPWRLSLRGNYTFTDSEQKSGVDVGLPITGNPAKHMLNTSLSWKTTDALSTTLQMEARSNRFNSRNATTGDVSYYKNYQVLHLAASYKFSPMLTINARVNNLLDRDFTSSQCSLAATQDQYSCVDDYLTKDKARSFWIGMNLRF